MIFIDGGHDGDIPFEDLKNALQLCKPGTLILVDDFHLQTKDYPEVRETVQHFIKGGHLVQLGHFAGETREMGIFKRIHSLEA
jgi:predicted O-methyltransferase YrrM